jgi:hypothetical protein
LSLNSTSTGCNDYKHIFIGTKRNKKRIASLHDGGDAISLIVEPILAACRVLAPCVIEGHESSVGYAFLLVVQPDKAGSNSLSVIVTEHLLEMSASKLMLV